MIALKDLRVEARARELAAAGLLTGFLAVAIGAVALGDAADKPAVVAGVLWLALSFAACLSLARGFTAEVDRGTLEILLLLPVERGALYAGKALASFALLAALAVVLVPVAIVFLGAASATALAALPVVLLGVAGLAAAGTLLASLAAHTRAREALLPVLLLPVALPVLLAALPATRAALAGGAVEVSDLSLLAGYDIALLAVSYLLFEFAAEG